MMNLGHIHQALLDTHQEALADSRNSVEGLDFSSCPPHRQQVKADPDFAGSLWAKGQYFPVLGSVLAASGNNCVLTTGRVTIECMGQTSTEVVRVFVTALTTASRVFHSCVQCGRQSFAVRTEIRNRVRYPNTPCVSCQALDLLRPDLAALVARDPATGAKRHPSRISVGSNQRCHFRCRAEGCPTIVERKVQTLARNGELPTCEAHRRRGDNFGTGDAE